MIGDKIAIGFSMVKNEEDIIENFIRWNMKFLDSLYIIDNNSTDGTVDIINHLISEGFNITLWVDDTLAHLQSEITTKSYHQISKINKKFDLFFAIDADEFLVVNSINFLNGLKPSQVFNLERYDYVMTQENLEDDIFISMNRRFKIKNKDGDKIFFSHDKDGYLDYSISQGNHRLSSKINKDIKKNNSDIWLAHFPYRGVHHYLNKIIIGSQAMLVRNKDFLYEKNPYAIHWREEYNYIKENNALISFEKYICRVYSVKSSLDLYELTVLDQLNLDSDIKYFNLRKNRDPLFNVIANFENLSKLFWMEKERSLVSLVILKLSAMINKIKSRKQKIYRSIYKRLH